MQINYGLKITPKLGIDSAIYNLYTTTVASKEAKYTNPASGLQQTQG